MVFSIIVVMENRSVFNRNIIRERKKHGCARAEIYTHSRYNVKQLIQREKNATRKSEARQRQKPRKRATPVCRQSATACTHTADTPRREVGGSATSSRSIFRTALSSNVPPFFFQKLNHRKKTKQINAPTVSDYSRTTNELCRL